MDASEARQLDPGRRSVESRDFEAGLRRKIVGQDEAVQAVVDSVSGVSSRVEFAGTAGGEFAVPRDRPERGRRGWWKRRRKCCLGIRAR